MHELGIITGVLDSAKSAAQDAGADRLLSVTLSVGEMTEAIEDALRFAFDALAEEDPYLAGASLEVRMIPPKSECLECGEVFVHDRFHMFCPRCDSFATRLLEGRELRIDSIEVDMPDEGPEEESHAD